MPQRASSLHLASPLIVSWVFGALLCLISWSVGCTSEGIPVTNVAAPTDPNRFIPNAFDGDVVEYASDGSVLVDPCDPNPCISGQRCEIDDTSGDTGVVETRCIPLTCDALSCEDRQRCEESEEGAVCIADLCSGPEGCNTDEYCGPEGVCIPDICTPNERRCNGAEVTTCEPDGSGFVSWVVCPLGEAQCVTSGAEAACGCIDDWDCPEHLRCERGLCQGRPEPAQCLLPPEPFSASIPTPEIVWGGSAEEARAPMSPFPSSVQVVMTPLVANLTDDNGDGLIDEGDSPEVIFMSFCGSSFTRNGALRAIHGGGPRRGQDLFANLGDQLWSEGDPLIDAPNSDCITGLLDPTAGLAVANLDAEGSSHPEPEIIGIHELDGVLVYDHRGALITQAFVDESPNVGPNPTPSVANLDGRGLAEVIVSRTVYTFAREGDTLRALDLFVGDGGLGTNRQGGVSCVADIDGDQRPEIVAGGTAYRMPKAPLGAESRADCVDQGGAITPSDEDELRWCRGELTIVWETSASPDVTPSENLPREGFCAVADVWGADPTIRPGPNNPLDARPEVILINAGVLHVLRGDTGEVIYQARYGDSNNDLGGAPNVGDFDGDGLPEIGSAFALGYVMMDLQPPSVACPEWLEYTEDVQDNGVFGRPARVPGGACNTSNDCAEGALCRSGQCICGHQGWRRKTEDDSSRVTGSTLFDFNGDGLVEVIYNDECFFRIYDGATGRTLFVQPSESRTRIEHPIVADVDADGNAEIIFSTSTESRFCSQRNQSSPLGTTYRELYNPGIEVWGDPQDRWVPARQIWNQHAYHVTHVSESAQIPLAERPGWVEVAGRSYNSYRAQPPSYGIAPDLTIEALRATSSVDCLTSADASDALNLSVTVYNRGDVQVGSGIEVTFSTRAQPVAPLEPLLNPNGEPLTAFTPAVIPPGGGVTLSLLYDGVADPTRQRPLTSADELIAVIDRGGPTGFGRERECNEDNNELSAFPNVAEAISDLRITLDDVSAGICPELNLALTVYNEGQGAVRDFELGLYLGDAQNGGVRLDTLTVRDEINAGESLEIIWVSERFPEYRTASVSVVVDPQNVILECDDANNASLRSAELSCEVLDGQ